MSPTDDLLSLFMSTIFAWRTRELSSFGQDLLSSPRRATSTVWTMLWSAKRSRLSACFVNCQRPNFMAWRRVTSSIARSRLGRRAAFALPLPERAYVRSYQPGRSRALMRVSSGRSYVDPSVRRSISSVWRTNSSDGMGPNHLRDKAVLIASRHRQLAEGGTPKCGAADTRRRRPSTSGSPR